MTICFHPVYFYIHQNLKIMDQENKNLFGLTIEANTASTMSSSAQWSRILAWCGIIMGALLVIFGLLFQGMSSKATSGLTRFESNDGFAGSMAFAGGAAMVMYISMGGLTRSFGSPFGITRH